MPVFVDMGVAKGGRNSRLNPVVPSATFFG